MSADFDDVKNMVLIRPSDDYIDSLNTLISQINTIGRQVEEGERKAHVYDALVLDEADMLFVKNEELGSPMRELLAMHRHYKIAVIFITRRVQDIPPRIVEACKHMFFFKIEGNNVRKYMDNIDPRIGELLDTIEYDSHQYVYKEIGKQPTIGKAV